MEKCKKKKKKHIQLIKTGLDENLLTKLENAYAEIVASRKQTNQDKTDSSVYQSSV